MDVKISLPLLPLRDIVVFPNMVIPLFVGRDKSIVALNEVMKKDKKIILVTQKNSEIDDPKKTDIFMYGCEGSILQLLKLPDGTVKILVEGVKENLTMSNFFDKNNLDKWHRSHGNHSSNRFSNLKDINLKLWDIENGKRAAEKNNDFGEKFIELARKVYKYNDERSKIKLKINNILGSNIV